MDLIVAVDENWGIGLGGTQTVVVPEDRRRFREITGGGTIVVGRKTLADFPGGKPLKNRLNIVLTHTDAQFGPGAQTAGSVQDVLEIVRREGLEKVFVCGGESVYRLLLPYCRYAYVTKLYAAPAADRFFPNLDTLDGWVLETPGEIRESDGLRYAFLRYENRNVLEKTPEM